MMRKLYNTIMIAICVIMLFGCSARPDMNTGAINAEVLPVKNDQYSLINDNSGELSITKSQNGYYILGGLHRYFLSYMDKLSMKPVFLCNKPDCLHANEKRAEKLRACNAYLCSNFGSWIVSAPIYYESNLYIVIAELNNAMQSINYLYKISGDGTKREKIYTFKQSPNYIIIHYDYLYFVISDNASLTDIDDTDGKAITKTKISRINIYHPDTEPEVLFEYEGLYATIGHLTGYKDAVYFNCMKFIDATMQTNESPLYSFNLQTGKVTQIYPDTTGKFAICGGKLVCFNFTLGNNYVSELNGSMRILMKSTIGMPYSDDRYILTDTSYLVGRKMKDKNGKEITRNELKVYDLNGSELQSFEFHQYMEILGSDENYIFLWEIEDNQQKLYYINKNDIQAGKASLVNFCSVPEDVNGMVTYQ